MIRIEVDHEQKERVENTLKGLGISIGFAVQTFLHTIDRTGRLPFDIPDSDSGEASSARIPR